MSKTPNPHLKIQTLQILVTTSLKSSNPIAWKFKLIKFRWLFSKSSNSIKKPNINQTSMNSNTQNSLEISHWSSQHTSNLSVVEFLLINYDAKVSTLIHELELHTYEVIWFNLFFFSFSLYCVLVCLILFLFYIDFLLHLFSQNDTSSIHVDIIWYVIKPLWMSHEQPK